VRRNAKLERDRAQLIISAAVSSLHARKLDRAMRLSNELDCVSRRGLFNTRWMKHAKHIESVSDQPRRTKARRSEPAVRETEEARKLLQDQLHSLYWWVFNACRIKGFLRAKKLDELPPEQPNTPADAATLAKGERLP
jgi:hypothetical protein